MLRANAQSSKFKFELKLLHTPAWVDTFVSFVASEN
jgi:hypothetical protein